LYSQPTVDLSGFVKSANVKVNAKGDQISITWRTSPSLRGRIIFNLNDSVPLIRAMQLISGKDVKNITENVNPSFILTTGKRDLVSQNGWNIFFDRVPLKPFQAHRVIIQKQHIAVKSEASRTIVTIGKVSAAEFEGDLEFTLYNESPLINIAAVISTAKDSTAILYDAGLTGNNSAWDTISWADVYGKMQRKAATINDTSASHAVKYRTILAGNKSGCLAIFPAPHQYFYPLDEAFNLNFTWSGKDYRNLFDEFGIGIRQDLYGDKRFVPWFNAPPGTRQRLNFFCLLSPGNDVAALEAVKEYTNGDKYPMLGGYKRFASHFHNEFVMNVMIPRKPVPDTPSFVKVFKALGVDIVHLGEFHYTAHPKGPDEQRLKELHELFKMCSSYSDSGFLLLPGEEPNEFYGGHWLEFFPNPVYWIMSRARDVPFISNHPEYGKVYRVNNSEEMLKLLELEHGLAWTAHPRTKGSTGYPDKYKSDKFFTSERFMGAAWKPIPADLSIDRLGIRALDLMDDMNNWGLRKKMISEADLFTIEPENEMYAHLNVNYLQLSKLPEYKEGWQPVLDVLESGRFFSTTGEVLLPAFTINKKSSGDTLRLDRTGMAELSFTVNWTFPLNFALLVTGDGNKVFKEKIDLRYTHSFGVQTFRKKVNLAGRKWARLEVWDAAVNGAFTQTIWLQ